MGAGTEHEPGGGQATTPQTAPEGGSGQQGTAGDQSEAGRLERLERELAALKAQAHGGSQQVVQDRLDGPGAIADEVRGQLEARDRERAAQAEKDGLKSTIAGLEQAIKDMREKPPEPPVRRVERVMGWRS